MDEEFVWTCPTCGEENVATVWDEYASCENCGAQFDQEELQNL